MSNKPISQLQPVSAVSDDDLFLISEKQSDGSYVSKSARFDQIKSSTPSDSEQLVTDPARLFFGATGQVIDSQTSAISGDPFIVRDDLNAQWIIFLFRTTTSSPFVKTFYKTLPYANGLQGVWSEAFEIVSLSGFHKFVVLVDIDGVPVKVNDLYHGYAVSFDGTLASKEITHFTSTSLTGVWVLGSKVIPKGAAGSKDAFNADATYVVFDQGLINLWYMAAPSESQATYGLATRMLSATASNPDGPFTKNYDDVILPSTNNSDWDYGWLGGMQIRKRPDNTFIMVYNAGDTRPPSAGHEPNVSRIGYAYADSLIGPWVKDIANPYLSATNTPSDAVENTNIWRGHLAYDHFRDRYMVFYNTGNEGVEKITRTSQRFYEYQYSPGAAGTIQVVTNVVTAVANSRVNLPAGTYRVCYQLNLIAKALGSGTPKLDIDSVLRINGVAYRTNRDFIGNFDYDNRDTVLNYIVDLASAGYVDLAVQVTGGTAQADTYCRRLRVSVEQIT